MARWRAMGAARCARRRAGAAVALAVLLGLLVQPALPARAESVAYEYALKATYLYKFGHFVEWPASAFPSPESPLYLCVVGNGPFKGLLQRAVRGQHIDHRNVVVRMLHTVGRNSGCHIMYAAGSAAQTVADILVAVRGTPVLTVTDGARRSDEKGIINFVMWNDRVRFEIDDRAAAANGIAISSKLLSLAVAVTRRD